MAKNPLHDIAVVAVHNTRQARRLDVAEDQLLLEAIRGVLAAAGLRAMDIDGVNVDGLTDNITPYHAISWLGGRACWAGMQLPGIAAVMEAAGAIALGQCNTVLLAAGQSGAYRGNTETAPWTRPNYEFAGCWGMYTAAQFALVARRHMHIYGTPVEALAEVASSIRTNGAKNPQAVFYGKPVSRQDVLGSRMIADPFHLLDCSITSEGGAALILTTRERARDLDVTPIFILGGCVDRQGVTYNTPPVWDQCGHLGKRAADICFEQAGLARADVDVAELYDPFSFEIIRQLEAYGFCKPGEAADFVLDGNIRLGGRLPVVTNGGLLSFSHAGRAQSLQKVIAAVMQLRGMLPPQLTVPNAKVAICSNNGSAALAVDVMLLGTERTA
jgi:acetyl-CoA acetyltransferase